MQQRLAAGQHHALHVQRADRVDMAIEIVRARSRACRRSPSRCRTSRSGSCRRCARSARGSAGYRSRWLTACCEPPARISRSLTIRRPPRSLAPAGASPSTRLPIHRATSRRAVDAARSSSRRRRVEHARQRPAPPTSGRPSIIVRRTSPRRGHQRAVERARGARTQDRQIGGRAGVRAGPRLRVRSTRAASPVTVRASASALSCRVACAGSQLVEQIALAAQSRIAAERQTVRHRQTRARPPWSRTETDSTIGHHTSPAPRASITRSAAARNTPRRG